ncbi:hypothetical protein HN385_01840 [archaeon]|nr:hypothetical protein [archaeon]MBT3451252.1 hypothetical protein [archaeon]MBT6869430.1 hypothetical protein [archaeon]MBT7192593.1 hypothetical protein [archaeon]MBT7380669.1 hypothetical protein [archaeon]
MVKDKHKSIVDNAVKWLASEFNYFKDLQGDLNALRKAIGGKYWKKGQASKQVKSAMHDYLYAARSERKFERNLKLIKEFKFSENYQLPNDYFNSIIQSNVGDLGAKLQQAQEEVKEIQHRLDIEGNHLVFAASYFRGEIRIKLNEIKELIFQDEKIRLNKDEWDISDKEEEDLLNLEKSLTLKVNELLNVILEAVKWLNALSSDLGVAKKIFNQHQAKREITPQFIRASFGIQIEALNSSNKNVNSYKKQLTILSQFLNPKLRGGLPKSALVEIKRLMGIVVSRSKILHNGGVRDIIFYAGQVYYDNGLITSAQKVWAKGGDYLIDVRDWSTAAAKCYEKAKLWKKAAKAYEKDNNSLHDAARCYQKSGIDGYRKIGMSLMRLAVNYGKSGYNETVGRYFDQAGRIFHDGRLFDLAGKCYEMKADLIVKQRKGNQYEYYDWSFAFHDYKWAFKEYKEAGNQGKLNELLPKIRYAEECNCRVRNNDRNFLKQHSTDGNFPNVAYPKFNPGRL